MYLLQNPKCHRLREGYWKSIDCCPEELWADLRPYFRESCDVSVVDVKFDRIASQHEITTFLLSTLYDLTIDDGKRVSNARAGHGPRFAWFIVSGVRMQESFH